MMMMMMMMRLLVPSASKRNGGILPRAKSQGMEFLDSLLLGGLIICSLLLLLHLFTLPMICESQKRPTTFRAHVPLQVRLRAKNATATFNLRLIEFGIRR